MHATLYRHLSDKNELLLLSSGKTLLENLPSIDFDNAIILINGKKADAKTVLSNSDIVMIRLLPAESTGSEGWDIFLGVITFGIFTGVVAYNQSKKLDAELEKLKKQSNNDSIDNRPFIRGASNGIATNKGQPYICGRHLFTPYLLSYPFYKIAGADGADQFYYAVLECGFNKQILKQIKVDDVVIKDFSDTAPQQGVYDFNAGSGFFSSESKLEIIQNGGLFSTIPELNVKTVAETANKQIPFADQIADGSKTHLQFTLTKNAKSVDVVITFNNGLFAYNDNNDKISTSIEIIPEFSTNNGMSWVPFYFNQNGTTSNIFNRNAQKEIRFTAHRDFTASEVANLSNPVLVRVRTTANKDNKKTNVCYVMYVQSTCFDADEWAQNRRFVDCKIVQDRERAFCTMLGIRIKATDANQDKLNKINIITQGVARTWNGSAWSAGKSATRNPAAFLLEVLTSASHAASRFDDSEIDLPSIGDLYEYCAANDYCYDKVLTDGITKKDTISSILTACDSALYWNINGKLSVATDAKKEHAMSVFNSQNIISIENKKEFARRTDGMRIKFVNAAAGYAEDSYLVMRKGQSLNQDSVLRELTVDGITEYQHIVKYARRLMAAESLRPKTTTIQVGHEGVFFTPYSKILLQDDSLKIGLSSGIIQSVKVQNGFITELMLYDAVEFAAGNHYGMVINCVNEKTAAIVSVKVTGSGITKTVSLVNPIPVPPADKPQTIPSSGDTFSFGLLNGDGSFSRITSPFLITGMRRTDNGYSLELVDYNEAMYDTGDIPEYTSNITELPGKSNAEIKPDYVTKEDLFDIVGTDKVTEYPDNVFGVTATAERDYIQIKWTPIGNGNRNRLQKYLVRISRDGGKTFTQYEAANIEYIYYFTRDTDGYLEREAFTAYCVQVKAVNMVGKESLQWSETVSINTATYGTWLPSVPLTASYVSKRTVQLNFTRNDCYGFKEYRVQISKDGLTWYSGGDSTSAETNEAAWSGTRDWYTAQAGSQYTQVMPLTGQASGLPLDTTYYFRVASVTAVPTSTNPAAVNVSAYSAAQAVLARATGVSDIVANAIGTAQLQQNVVKLDNLNVLAKNVVNSFIDGTKEGWNTEGSIVTDPSTGLPVLELVTTGNPYFTSNNFDVLPDDIFCFSFGIETKTYVSGSGLFLGLTSPQSFEISTYDFTDNKWGAWGAAVTNRYFINDYKSLSRKYFKTYIAGKNVAVDKLPPPSFTDTSHTVMALRMTGTNKSCHLRTGFNATTEGTKWWFITPQIYRIGDGKVVANNIICNDLVSIAGKFGYIDTAKIQLDETNFMTAEATTIRQKDGSSYAAAAREVCFGTTVKITGYADTDEFFHYKPGSGFFFKIANFIVTATASMIKGTFQVFRKGESKTPVLEVQPGSSAGNESTTVRGALRVKKSQGDDTNVLEVLPNGYIRAHNFTKIYQRVDLSDLDGNTYYPVTFYLSDSSNTGWVEVCCYSALNTNVPSWSTHPAGFSVFLSLLTNPDGWGTLTEKTIVLRDSASYCGKTPAGYSQMSHSCNGVFWLRGGGIYNCYCSHSTNFTIRTSEYTAKDQSVAPRSSRLLSYNKSEISANINTDLIRYDNGLALTSYTDSRLRISNNNGAANIGAANSEFFHFETERPRFYMNRTLSLNGNLESYGGTKTISGFTVWGAVGNDITDNITLDEPIDNFEYGYCYCFDGTHKRGNRGITLGIASDTAAVNCGKATKESIPGVDYLPVCIGGFVLAYLDAEYPAGTKLMANNAGVLTKRIGRVKVIAEFYRKPDVEDWNGVRVGGRMLVKVV